MNVTDMVMLIAGSFFVIRGIFKGLSGEIISLVSTIGGFFCAVRFYSPLSSYIASKLNVSVFASSATAMLGIFFVIFFVCTLVEKGLKKIIKETNLTSTDKMLGAIAGFIKIYVIAVLVLICGIFASPLTGESWVRESKILILTARTWPIISPVLDRLGLMPDVESLQTNAREFVLKQAATSLFGADVDVDALLGQSVTSSDNAASFDAPADIK